MLKQYSEKKNVLIKKIAALKNTLHGPGTKKATSTIMLEDLLRQCIGDLDQDESVVLNRVQSFERATKKPKIRLDLSQETQPLNR